jgi:tetratricopeptide (TPR) repeat protein
VNTVPTIDPVEFVSTIKPLIASNDARMLMQCLQERWSATQIAGLLDGENVDSRKVAAMCLGLIGRKCALEPLRRALADSDACVHQMAEHAMWSIWFKLGTEEANSQLIRGTMATERREFACACKHFSKAIELDPQFAEPFNQRAIVHYLKEEFSESIDDCRQAIKRMPCHFGAWAGMGHCHAHLGDFCQAIDCYAQALDINPGLDGIREAIAQLRCSS